MGHGKRVVECVRQRRAEHATLLTQDDRISGVVQREATFRQRWTPADVTRCSLSLPRSSSPEVLYGRQARGTSSIDSEGARTCQPLISEPASMVTKLRSIRVTSSNRSCRVLDENAGEAGRGAARLGLTPLTLDIEGQVVTFRVEEGRLSAVQRSGDALVVALDRGAFSDLMQDVASTFGIQMSGRAQVQRGNLDMFVEWEPVLRCLLDGRPGVRTRIDSLRGSAGSTARPGAVVLTR